MKFKTILLIIITILLLLIINANAMPDIHHYNGVIIKFYQKQNQDDCIKNITQFKDHFYEDLIYVKVTMKSKRHKGYYMPPGYIWLYGNCDTDVIRHELAHHHQYVHGDSIQEIKEHKGIFMRIYEEVR